MYTLRELNEIVTDLGLDDALIEIHPDMIIDSTLRGYWDDAITAYKKIRDVLDADDTDDSDDEDDIDYGEDDEND